MAIISRFHTANVRTVEHILRTPNVRNELKQFFSTPESSERTHTPVYEETNQILESILSKVNSIIQLPNQIKAELLYVASQMSIVIIKWLDGIRWESKLLNEEFSNEIYSEIIDHIYWTDSGSVDCKKIFRSLCATGKMPHNMLCLKVSELCLEDCIDEMWSEDREKWPNDSKPWFNPADQFSHGCASYWDCQYRRKLLEQNSDLKPEINLLFRLQFDGMNEGMLRVAVKEGHYPATRYFWNKLTSDQRNSLILEQAGVAAKYSAECVDDFEDFLANYENFAEIFYFLLEQMTDQQISEFLSSQENVILYLISLLSWPLQDFFISEFNSLKNRLDDNYDEILFAIVGKICKKENSIPTVYKYTCIYNEIWKGIPDEIVQRSGDRWPDWVDVVGQLVHYDKVEHAKFVMVQFKDTIYKEITPDYSFCLTNYNSFEALRYFVDEVLESESERRVFKSAINTFRIYNKYTSEEFEFVGREFLAWRFDNNEEEIQNYLKITHEEELQKSNDNE